MKYLIIKCTELGDQWECDANRIPVCITDDKDKYYKVGYEIYELQKDNTFKLIKGYEEAGEKGFALYRWEENIDIYEDNVKPEVLKKWVDKDRNKFSRSMIKNLKAEIGFTKTIKTIMSDIVHYGSHGEVINGYWTVLGEYQDDCYDKGW